MVQTNCFFVFRFILIHQLLHLVKTIEVCFDISISHIFDLLNRHKLHVVIHYQFFSEFHYMLGFVVVRLTILNHSHTWCLDVVLSVWICGYSLLCWYSSRHIVIRFEIYFETCTVFLVDQFQWILHRDSFIPFYIVNTV